MNTIDGVIEVTAQVLIRCTIMGVVARLIWWGALALAGDLVYSVHAKMIAPMSRQQFDIIHYVGTLMTKAAVSLLFFFPYIAIRLVIKKRSTQSSNKAIDSDKK